MSQALIILIGIDRPDHRGALNTVVVMWLERKVLGAHAGRARPDAHRLARPDAALRRRAQAPRQGGPRARGRGPSPVPHRADHRVHAVDPGLLPRRRGSRSSPGDSLDVGIFYDLRGRRALPRGHPARRLGVAQQVLADRRLPCRGAADQLRGADDPRGDGRRHARGLDEALGRSSSCAVRARLEHRHPAVRVRRCSSSASSPSSTARRSTCPRPSPSSSAASTPSTRACGSRCSSSPSTRTCSPGRSSPSLLFFGGWTGPVLRSASGRCSLKTYAVVFLVIWVRATFPRMRVDQLMAIGWKVLLPAALVNVLLTAVGIVTNVWVLIGFSSWRSWCSSGSSAGWGYSPVTRSVPPPTRSCGPRPPR